MHIIFMGTPDFAVPSLQALLESKHNVTAVFTQPPRKSGRGQRLQKSPIHQLAEAHKIEVYTPQKLDAEAQEIIKNLNPDAICVAAYGMLLPQAVLDIAPCINVHPSALPRWRGAAPLHHTILAGDKTTDICIMEMEKGLDNGAVYLRKSYDIGADETTGELHDKLSKDGGKMLVEVLDDWQNISQNPTPQAETGLTYAHKFKPEELPQIRALDFTKPAEAVHNQIRGLSPWPGATAIHNDVPLKILGSHLIDIPLPSSVKAGEVIAIDSNGITLACGKLNDCIHQQKNTSLCDAENNHAVYTAITLTKLQKPSKQAMQASDFLKGYDIKVGDLLK